MRRLVWIAGIAGLIVFASSQGADPVIRVTVDLVQVDAVVTDSQGRHVRDLKAADFEILEDGKPQAITHFSYVEGTAASQQRPKGQAAVAVNLAPAKALRPEQVARTIVMIADDLALSADDIPNVRKAMKSFVDRQMKTGDLVSVMTTSGGMGALQQLTNDRSQIYASIDRIRYQTGRTGLTWYEAVHKVDLASEIENESNARLNAVRRPSLGNGTLGALTYAIQGLRELPGRKAIALFSDGFPQSASGIVELANRASVVIYTLDPRGVVAFALSAVDVCKLPLCNPRAEEAKRQTVYRESQRSLDQLARGTGGIFFHDDNGLDEGLAHAIDDMGSYYLIGYQPQRADFDAVRGVAQFHRIEVKVRRAGLLVRSRNEFIGTPDSAPLSEDSAGVSGREELRKALLSPFHANGFPVHLSAFYSATARKDAKTGRRPTLLRAMLAIDAHNLRFGDAPDGGKQLNIEVVAAAYGANNDVVARSDKTFTAAMTVDEMSQIVASGLVYDIDIAITRPGPYQLRVAAWDAGAERTGSAAVFVEVPDFNRVEIALSSVLIFDSDAKRNEDLSREGVMGAGSPVTRVFAPGAVLGYDCTVFGALPDPHDGKAKVDIEVRLFRGPEQIFRGQAIPLKIADGNSADAVHATGEIRLPATLPPGDYAVELSAIDRLQKKQVQRAGQWVDFTLVGNQGESRR